MRDPIDDFLLELDATEYLEVLDLDVAPPVPDMPAEPKVKPPPNWTQVTSASIWLHDYLNANGPQTPEAISKAALRRGLTPSAVMERAKNRKKFIVANGLVHARLTAAEWVHKYLTKHGESDREVVLRAGVAVGYRKSNLASAATRLVHVRSTIMSDGRIGWRFGPGGVERKTIHQWIHDYLLEHGETKGSIVADACIAAGVSSPLSVRTHLRRIPGFHARWIGKERFWSIHTSRREAPPPNIPAP